MPALNPDLLMQAKELNIQVTENATNEALQAAIDEVLAEDASAAKPKNVAKVAAAKPKDTSERLIPVRINRDFWDPDGKRHSKGTIIEVPMEAALDGVETGALSRVK